MLIKYLSVCLSVRTNVIQMFCVCWAIRPVQLLFEPPVGMSKMTRGLEANQQLVTADMQLVTTSYCYSGSPTDKASRINELETRDH